MLKAPQIAGQLRQSIEGQEERGDMLRGNASYLMGEEGQERVRVNERLIQQNAVLHSQQRLLMEDVRTRFAESEEGYRNQQQQVENSIRLEQLEQWQILANLQARRDYFRTPEGREAAQGQAAVGKQVEQAKFDADWAQMEAERGKMGAAMGMLGREIGDIGVILPGQFGHLFGKISQFSRAFESIGRIAGALFGGGPEEAAWQPEERRRAGGGGAPRLPAGAPRPPGAPSAGAAEEIPYGEIVGGAEGAAGAAEGAGMAAGTGGALAAAVGPIGMIAAASIVAIEKLNSVVSGTVHAMGNFAAAIASPNMDPSVPIGAAGSAIEGFGSKVLFISPALGIFATGLGSAVSALAQFMNALDQLARRYEDYSPQIAQAQAMAEMRTMQGEMSRARRIGPAMSEYIGARTDLQEQFENIKIRLLQALLPLATRALERIGNTVEFLEKIFDANLEIAKIALEAKIAGVNIIPEAIRTSANRIIEQLRGEDEEMPWDVNAWIQQEIGESANWPGG